MKLAQIETKGCRSVPDGTYSMNRKDGNPADLVIVTGPAGAGKTTFLELVIATKEVIGCYLGMPNSALVLRQGLPGARVNTQWQLTQAEASWVGLPDRESQAEVLFSRSSLSTTSADPGLAAILGRFSAKFDVGILDYFPEDRDLPNPPAGADISEFEMKRTRFERGARKYTATALFARRLLSGGHDPDGRGAILRTILGIVLPYLKPVGLNGMGQLEFHRSNGEAVPMERLSSSERQAVIFAATPVLVGARDSIILIDTPEKHLGPGEASRLVGALRDHLPENQWIVATRDADFIAQNQQHAAVIELGKES